MTIYDTLCYIIDSEFKNKDGSWKENSGNVLNSRYVHSMRSLDDVIDSASIECFIGASMAYSRFLNTFKNKSDDHISFLERTVAIRFWQVLYERYNLPEETEAVSYVLECMSNPLGTMGFSSIIPLSETVH